MFFHKPSDSKKEIINQVNQQLTETLNAEFNKTREAMKATLLSNGIKPGEVDKLLEEIKNETQIEMLKKFRERLQLKVEDRLKESSTRQQTNSSS